MPKEQSKFITKTREQLYEMFMNSLKEDTLPWEKPWRSGAEDGQHSIRLLIKTISTIQARNGI